MKILILALVGLSAILLIFNVYMGFIFKRPPITESKEIVRIEQSVPQKVLSTGVLDLGKMTINLVKEKNVEGDRFLQTTVSLEYISEDPSELESQKGALLDEFINEVSFRKINQLDSFSAKIDLKTALIRRFNHRLNKSIIRDIYFDAFTIQ